MFVHLQLMAAIFCSLKYQGNTLGTVISNSILLSLFNKQEANTFFNALRILEDECYQAIIRQYLGDYIGLVIGMALD